MPFLKKVLSNQETQTGIQFLLPKNDEVLIMRGIANSVKLLLSFAIEETRAYSILEKMYYLSIKNNEVKSALIENKSTSIYTLYYLSFIFKYVSSGNIPIAFSALAPCFLLKKKQDPESENIKNEIKIFLNLVAEDQTVETKKIMQNVILNSIRIYSSIR